MTALLALLTNRTVLEVAGVVLLLCGFTFYERHAGAQRCVRAQVAAVTAQEAHNAALAVTEAATINREVITHANAIALPPLPTPALRCVRVDSAPRPLPQAPAAGARSDAAPLVSAAAGPGPQPAFDPGPAIGKVGQACDAQVVELQDYIRRVVLAP